MWIVIIAAILLIGIVVYSMGKKDAGEGRGVIVIDNPTEAEYVNIQTSDDTFNEIDNALEFVE